MIPMHGYLKLQEKKFSFMINIQTFKTMVKSPKLVLVISFLSLLSCQKKESFKEYQQVLWYDQPAANWMQALPVGNGRLGAMVFGDPQHERIQLNEDSMWSGAPDWGNSKGTEEDLIEIRQLLKDGKNQEVDKLIVDKFSYRTIKRSHQTMGDLYINFQKEKNLCIRVLPFFVPAIIWLYFHHWGNVTPAGDGLNYYHWVLYHFQSWH